MEKIDYLFMSCVEEAYDLSPKILELGARVIGTQGDLHIRKIFAAKNNKNDYVGVDYIEGPGVDLVANVQDIPLPDGSFNTIVAMNLFEHVEKFWLVFDEMKRLSSDDGVIICATPFSYDIHGCPYDYYRFTPYFYENQFRQFKYRIHVSVGDRNRPKIVYAIASNNDLLRQKFDVFKELLLQKHRQLVPIRKALTYKLRSLLCGNHFKGAIGHFGDLNIDLFVGDDVPSNWR